MDAKEVIKKLRCPELPDGLVMVNLETRQEAIKALEKLTAYEESWRDVMLRQFMKGLW